jgi:hypothetical protein
MPTIDIPDKICPHCGGTRWCVSEQKYKVVSGEIRVKKNYRCSKRGMEISEKYRKNNIEKYKKSRREYVKLKRKIDPVFRETKIKRDKLYYKEHKKEIREYRKKWTIENLDKNRGYSKKYSKKQSEKLSGYYVTKLLTARSNILKEDIPQELIELKRKQLLLKRQLNDL